LNIGFFLSFCMFPFYLKECNMTICMYLSVYHNLISFSLWICRYVLLCHATFSNSGHFSGSCFRYRSNTYTYQFTHILTFQISIAAFHKELHYTILDTIYFPLLFHIGWVADTTNVFLPQIPLVFLTRYLQDKFQNIMVCCP